jgi:hypothetical protein
MVPDSPRATLKETREPPTRESWVRLLESRQGVSGSSSDFLTFSLFTTGGRIEQYFSSLNYIKNLHPHSPTIFVYLLQIEREILPSRQQAMEV